MIFPDVTLKFWKRKYPELSVLSRKCTNCGTKLTANKPFITRDYVGLCLPNEKCACGKNKLNCMSAIAISKEEIANWNRIIGSFK